MKAHNFPKQSAPVIRHVSSATISGEQGVEASGFFDDIWHGVKTYGPGIAKAVAGAL